MLQAIETAYKGYRFRSRLEARWAVFFDVLGVRWEYEKEGFRLKPNDLYLPDFWLPDFVIDHPDSPKGVWIEIKDERMEREPSVRLKAHLLGAQNRRIAVFCGLPGPDAFGTVCTGSSEYPVWFADYQRRWLLTSDHSDISPRGWKTLESALYRARSARFEHGERPS